MSQLSTGAKAPDFTLSGLDGNSRRLGEASSKAPLVLIFYKASCPTCQFTFPYLQKIYSTRLKGSPVSMWAISQDEAEETRTFVNQYGLEFEVLIDPHPYAVSASYGVEFVPAVFRVEMDGTISLSDFGFTKASLNAIAGYEFLRLDDGSPASRPG